MDAHLPALAVIVPVAVLAGVVVWLVVRWRRRRPGSAHLFRGQGQAVTVAELLEEAAERGEGVRLNWPDTDLDEAGLVRPYVQDQFPTAILPRLFGEER
jgi:hypothetical protein